MTQRLHSSHPPTDPTSVLKGAVVAEAGAQRDTSETSSETCLLLIRATVSCTHFQKCDRRGVELAALVGVHQ